MTTHNFNLNKKDLNYQYSSKVKIAGKETLLIHDPIKTELEDLTTIVDTYSNSDSQLTITVLTSIGRLEPFFIERLARNLVNENMSSNNELEWVITLGKNISVPEIHNIILPITRNSLQIKIIKPVQCNSTAPEILNNALEHIDSDLLFRIDHDDTFTENSINLLTNTLLENHYWVAGKTLPITSGGTIIKTHNKNNMIPGNKESGEYLLYRELYKTYPFHGNAAVTFTHIIKEFNGWPTNPIFKYHYDQYLWAITHKYSGYFLNAPVMLKTLHENSHTQTSDPSLNEKVFQHIKNTLKNNAS